MSDYGIRPVKNSIVVTPHDTNVLIDTADGNVPVTTRAICVGVAGDVAFVDNEGHSRIVKNLAAGILHPISTTRILATGTDAQEICALW